MPDVLTVQRSARFGVLAVAGAIVYAFGLPILLGLSWFPLPHGPFVDPAAYGAAPGPRFTPALDDFSFPHVDWPWRRIARAQLLAGEFPLWNPLASLGLPFAAQHQNQLFLPLEWIEILLGLTAWNVLLVLKILLGALGTYILAGGITRDGPARAYAAAAYGFSAFPIWLQTVPAFANAVALIPWLTIAAFGLLRERAAIAKSIGGLGIASGLLWLSGQPQLSALAHLAILLMVPSGLAAGEFPAKQAVLRALALAAGLALGLLIASPQLALLLQALRHGYTLHSAGAFADSGTSAMNFSLPVFPFLLGQLMTPWNTTLFPQRVNWEAFPVVLGGAGLLLCALGLVRIALSSRAASAGARTAPLQLVLLLAIGIVVLTVVVLGSIGVPVWHVPGLDRINFPRYSAPVLALAIALVGAWGLEGMARRGGSVGAWGVLLAIGVVALSIALAVPAYDTQLDPAGLSYMRWSMLLGAAPPVITLVCTLVLIAAASGADRASAQWRWAVLLCALAESLFLVRYGLDLPDEGRRLFVLCLTVLSALLAARRLVTAATISAAGAASLLALVLWTAPHRLPERSDPYEMAAPHISFLQEALGRAARNARVLATNRVMTPNVASAFGIPELCSLNPVQVKTSAEFVLRALSRRAPDYTTPNAWPGVGGDLYPGWEDYLARRSMYNLTATRYLVDRRDGKLSGMAIPDVARVYGDTHVQIYEDRAALTRAFLLTAARAVGSPEEALRRMLSPGFDPRSFAYVEDGRRLVPAEILGRAAGTYTAASIVEQSGSSVSIEARAAERSLLVLSDAYFTGWTATVNSAPAEILRVNSAFRGVLVPAGVSLVRFSYWPRNLGWFLGTALLAFALACLLACRRYPDPRLPARALSTAP